MSFPETRLTLIQRLASGGNADDWQGFMHDYWGPVCRFALRSGAGQLSDAEDVASQAFAVLWERGLLLRWVASRTARLRSLLCSVTHKILANRHRVQAGRERLNRETADQWAQPEAVESQHAEMFYAAWVEDLLRQALEELVAAYRREAKGDYVRVLYSRLCEDTGMAEIAQELGITLDSVNNYFRRSRQRLADTLKTLVRRQIARYTSAEALGEEFQDEWRRLGEHLEKHGGLEAAFRRSYRLMNPAAARQNQQAGLRAAVERITSVINRSE